MSLKTQNRRNYLHYVVLVLSFMFHQVLYVINKEQLCILINEEIQFLERNLTRVSEIQVFEMMDGIRKSWKLLKQHSSPVWINSPFHMKIFGPGKMETKKWWFHIMYYDHIIRIYILWMRNTEINKILLLKKKFPWKIKSFKKL